MKLTKRAIDQAVPPVTGGRFLRDEGLKGFGLKLTSKGTRTFFIEKDIHGQSRRLTIGRYGQVTLDEARRIAQKKFAEIAEGRDPIADRRAQRTAATFGELVDLYVARHLPSKKSRINDEGILKHHLVHWRSRTLASLTRQDMIALHTKIGTQPSTVIRPGQPTARPAPRLANSVLVLLRSLFNLAVDWGLFTGPNPCVRIKKFPERARDRFVTPDELPRLWAAIQAEANPFVRAAFFIALLTGQRRSEVLTMQWTHLDFTHATWTLSETKSGRPHTLPLPHAVLAELAKLPRFEGNPFVFIGRWGRGHLVNIAKPWGRIKKSAKLRDVRIHDLRRTLGSWLVAQGHSLPLIGKTLNHSNVSTTQTYARLQLEPVRLALEANAAAMLAVVEKGPHADP